MAFTGLIGTIEPVVAKYLRALEGAGIQVTTVYLFGSYAAGTHDRWSDVDLAVVSPDFTGSVMDEQFRLMRLTRGVDVRIEPHPFRPEDFTADNPWAAEILRGGIKIV